jgi:hypothetical protein
MKALRASGRGSGDTKERLWEYTCCGHCKCCRLAVHLRELELWMCGVQQLPRNPGPDIKSVGFADRVHALRHVYVRSSVTIPYVKNLGL